MVLSPDSLVWAVNNTDERIKFNSIDLQPGQRRSVPFLWMVNHYGDPRSIPGMSQVVKHPDSDASLAVQSREMEINRVNVIWGIPEVKKTWDEIPHLEFYDENDERITTPFEDPSGLTTQAANTTVQNVRNMEDRIAQLESMIQNMAKVSGVPIDSLPFDVKEPIPADESTPAKSASPWANAEPVDMSAPPVDTGMTGT